MGTLNSIFNELHKNLTTNTSSTKDYNNMNVLVLGKVGAGKSSLINYIYNKTMMLSKAGGAVTSQGFHKQPSFKYKGLDVTVYDSWGLEADKTSEWKDLLNTELRRANANDVSDWFHTLIYCIDAEESRLDSFEKSQIIDPLIEQGSLPIFALTKWDLCSDIKKKAAIDLVKKYYPNCEYVPVCSVQKKFRNGTISSPTGKTELMEKMCLTLRLNLVMKALTIAEKRLNNNLSDARSRVLSYYDDETGPLGVFTYYGEELLSKLQEKSNSCFSSATAEVANYLNKQFSIINTLSKRVIQSYMGKSFAENEINNSLNGEIFRTSLDAWDNEWAEDIATVLTSVLSVGLFQFLKKGMYEDKLKDSLDVLSYRVKKSFEKWKQSVITAELNIKNSYKFEDK